MKNEKSYPQSNENENLKCEIPDFLPVYVTPLVLCPIRPVLPALLLNVYPNHLAINNVLQTKNSSHIHATRRKLEYFAINITRWSFCNAFAGNIGYYNNR